MLQRRTLLTIESSRTGASRLPVLRRAMTRIADKALALDRLTDFYHSIPSARDSAQFVDAAIENLGVTTRLHGAGLSAIPEQGPAIVVANHPFGGLDGLLLAQLLLKRRPDVRILTNRFLSVIPELHDIFISVDVFRGRDGVRDNAGALRKALGWVKSGGLLAMFPAGEVSHLKVDAGGIIDPVWPESAARIVRTSAAPVTPVYFGGRNSWLFQIAGLVHPRLRTALLPRELLNKAEREVTICIGKPIEPARIAAIDGNDVLASHLRLQTYSLIQEAPSRPAPAMNAAPMAEIVAPIDAGILEREIEALPAGRHLLSGGDMKVYVASRREAPGVAAEIGRLRELTFRAVGEGTGRPTDLDAYDDYYEQMFIWNDKRREIIGAYRIGRSDVIIETRGLAGLYTHSLFKYGRGFFGQLPPALELGRSFVRAEDQRSFTPLLLLWKGIAAYVARNPRYTTLFGAVSISNDYHPLSKEFLREYLSRAHYAQSLARHVRPRQKMRRKYSLKTLMHPWTGPQSIDTLGEVVSTLESDGKGIPVLLRQYLKLGGQIAGFNVDPEFADSIDCLLVVDLRHTEPRVLEKYMGKPEAARFLQHQKSEFDAAMSA